MLIIVIFMKRKTILLKLIKNLIMNEIALYNYEKITKENKLAAILIARKNIKLISDTMYLLENLVKVYKDEYLERALNLLKEAYDLLQEVAYGDCSKLNVLRSISYCQQRLPLLLDEAHSRIHACIKCLRRTNLKDIEIFKDILLLLEKARRETMPMKLYRLSLDMLLSKKGQN